MRRGKRDWDWPVEGEDERESKRSSYALSKRRNGGGMEDDGMSTRRVVSGVMWCVAKASSN